MIDLKTIYCGFYRVFLLENCEVYIQEYIPK